MQHLIQGTLSMKGGDVVTFQLRQLLQKPSSISQTSDLKGPHLWWQQVIQSSQPVRVTVPLTKECQKRYLFSVRWGAAGVAARWRQKLQLTAEPPQGSTWEFIGIPKDMSRSAQALLHLKYVCLILEARASSPDTFIHFLHFLSHKIKFFFLKS